MKVLLLQAVLGKQNIFNAVDFILIYLFNNH